MRRGQELVPPLAEIEPFAGIDRRYIGTSLVRSSHAHDRCRFAATHSRRRFHLDQSGGSASRSGALGICIKPVKGSLNSRMRKIAQDVETAKIHKATTSVGLTRENIPML